MFANISLILIGAAFLAFAGGAYPPDAAPLTITTRLGIGLLGLFVTFAAARQLTFRMRCRSAYASGRRQTGTVRLLRPVDREMAQVELVFAGETGDWKITVSLRGLKPMVDRLKTGMQATAYLGDDGRLYGLDIGSIRTMPLAAGASLGQPVHGRTGLAHSH